MLAAPWADVRGRRSRRLRAAMSREGRQGGGMSHPLPRAPHSGPETLEEDADALVSLPRGGSRATSGQEGAAGREGGQVLLSRSVAERRPRGHIRALRGWGGPQRRRGPVRCPAQAARGLGWGGCTPPPSRAANRVDASESKEPPGNAQALAPERGVEGSPLAGILRSKMYPATSYI